MKNLGRRREANPGPLASATSAIICGLKRLYHHNYCAFIITIIVPLSSQLLCLFIS